LPAAGRPDARIDVTEADRMFSHDAMDQVLTMRRRLNDYLGEYQSRRKEP